MRRDEEDKDEAVLTDHYLSLAAHFAAAVYAWYAHGVWVALAVLVGLWAVISATNMLVLSRSKDDDEGERTFRTMRLLRWTWIALALIVVALTSTNISSDG